MKEYPPIVLEHLETLTDRTGVIQHAIYSIPNRRTGYTTDDNARALIVAIRQYERTRERSVLQLVSTYLSFVHYAQTVSKRFHNFMSFDQIFLDDEGSEDCFGRTLWALGYALSADIHENVRNVAKKLFDESTRWIPVLFSLRSRAHAIAGCYNYLRANPEADDIRDYLRTSAESLLRDYKIHSSSEWPWFEPVLSYDDALIPRGLLLAYQFIKDERFLKVALESLEFLTEVTIVDGVFQPVGCNGWYIRGQERAWFDQQPVDAAASVLAYLSAYEATQDNKHLDRAFVAFDWFFGENCLREPLYDPVTGGCYDALTPTGANNNQGSESTICCLLAQLAMVPYINGERKNEGKDQLDDWISQPA